MTRLFELLERLASLPPAVLLGAAAAAFIGLAAFPIMTDSPTYDEGMHLASGYSYLRARDYRMSPDNPPLAKKFAALPAALCLEPNWPEDEAAWTAGARWDFSFKFLYQSGNDPDILVRTGRFANLLWGLLLIGGVYGTARELFGPRGGLTALILATFSPPLLAFSSLITVDATLAALFFLTIVSYQRVLGGAAPRWTLYTGLLLGGALATKFTALLLPGILAFLLLRHLIRHRRGRLDWVHEGLNLTVIGLLALATVWGVYGFRASESPDCTAVPPGDARGLTPGLARAALELVRTANLLPRSYVSGLAQAVAYNTDGHPAFALGEYSTRGWWWYFPLAFLVKTPTCTLLLFFWGLGRWYRRSPREGPDDTFLAVAAAAFAIFAMKSQINVGLRHVLPIYPFLMVLSGGVRFGNSAPGRRASLAWAALLVGTGTAGLAAAPHFLASFNMPSRALFERHEMLVDSNLDWGQDLGRLKAWVERHGISSLKLAYFGTASPRHLGLQHEVLPGPDAHRLYLRHEPEWKWSGPLESGDYVAISLTHLSAVYAPEAEGNRRRFESLEFVDMVGHSIAIYRVP